MQDRACMGRRFNLHNVYIYPLPWKVVSSLIEVCGVRKELQGHVSIWIVSNLICTGLPHFPIEQ